MTKYCCNWQLKQMQLIQIDIFHMNDFTTTQHHYRLYLAVKELQQQQQQITVRNQQ